MIKVLVLAKGLSTLAYRYDIWITNGTILILIRIFLPIIVSKKALSHTVYTMYDKEEWCGGG